MRALMLEVPQSLLDERRRTGADLFDEVWDGVLHMVPLPSPWHQEFGSELLQALGPLAKRAGLVLSYETSIVRPGAAERDYRAPDLVAYQRAHCGARGVEGIADLAIEILSPNDESYDKLPFYAEVGVKEVIIVDPNTRAIERFVAEGGKPKKVTDVPVRSSALDVAFSVVAGPKLRLEWAGGAAEI
jgi:Uma2 family endonuclease